MNGMAIVGVGLEPVWVFIRIFESVVDAINLEPSAETIEALVDVFGNGRGENGIVVFQSGEARGGLLFGSSRCQRCRSDQGPVVGTDLRYAVFQMVHAVSRSLYCMSHRLNAAAAASSPGFIS